MILLISHTIIDPTHTDITRSVLLDANNLSVDEVMTS